MESTELGLCACGIPTSNNCSVMGDSVWKYGHEYALHILLAHGLGLLQPVDYPLSAWQSSRIADTAWVAARLPM